MAKHIKPSKKKEYLSEALKNISGRLSAGAETQKTPDNEKKPLAPVRELGILAVAFVLALILRFLPLQSWLRIILSLIPLFLAGYSVFPAALREALALELLQREFLVSLAALGCLALGECMEAVVLMSVYRLSALARVYIEEKTAGKARAFAAKWPKKATVQAEDGISLCPVESVELGEIIVVAPGEIIPLNGVVVEGISSVSTESISGEAYELVAAPGCELSSGCTNITNTLFIRVTKPHAASTAERLRAMTENAADGKTKRVFMTEKAARLYTPALTAIALLLAVVPSLITGEWNTWLHRAIVVLILSDPISLVFSLPLAYVNGIYAAAEKGIFFKETDSMEKLSRVRSMVMEKTGIVTDARFTITDVFPVDMSEEKLLAVAAAAELCSRHPIARAICAAGNIGALREELVSEFEEFSGCGVYALIGDHPIFVGTGAFLAEQGISYTVPSKPGTAVHVAMDGEYCGHILLSDKVRSRAFDALEAVRVQGVEQFVMLTGDVKSSTRRIASSLNFDLAKFELDAGGKKAAVKSLKTLDQGASVLAFVGSGADDVEAMEAADVGIAFNALSHYSALNHADVLIMDENIDALPSAVSTAKQSCAAAFENIIAFGVLQLIVLLLTIAGVTGLWTAIIAQTLLFAGLTVNAERIGSTKTIKFGKGKKHERST